MADQPSAEKWQVRMVRPGLPGLDRLPELGLPDLSSLPWLNKPVRPADIGHTLKDAMLARENMLEDVNYTKVVPNHYVVEVSQANFARQFRPIEGQILQQWRDRLLEDLLTANSRQGRKEFRFGGRLRMEVRAAADLRDNEARVLSRIEPDRPIQAASQPRGKSPQSAQPNQSPLTPPPQARPHVAAPMRSHVDRPAPNLQPVTRPEPPKGRQSVEGQGNAAAYLELVPTGERWAIYPGINTIGRSEACQVYLNNPVVLEKRLVSGQHAYIVMERGVSMLYDGAPDGRPSANGTYVNLRRVPQQGYRLQNGDAIVLAAVDPLYPRSDTPGVVTLYFWTERRG